VRAWKQSHQEVFLPLSHPPGEAQVDFGEATIRLSGQETKVALFVMTLPYTSSVSWASLDAASWCQCLRSIRSKRSTGNSARAASPISSSERAASRPPRANCLWKTKPPSCRYILASLTASGLQDLPASRARLALYVNSASAERETQTHVAMSCGVG